MPVLGSGHPQADVFLLKYAPDAVGDRGGRRLLRALRHRADEVAQAAGHRPARRLRDAVREVPGRPTRRWPTRRASRACVEELAIVAAARSSWSWARTRWTRSTTSTCPLARAARARARRRAAAHAVDRRARRAEHRRGARRGGGQARVLVGLPGARRVVRGPAAVLARRRRRPRLLPRRPRASAAASARALGARGVHRRADAGRGHRGGAGGDGRRAARARSGSAGAALLVAALDANDVGAAATPFEAILLRLRGHRLRGGVRRPGAGRRAAAVPGRHRHRPGARGGSAGRLHAVGRQARRRARRSSCPTGAPAWRPPAWRARRRLPRRPSRPTRGAWGCASAPPRSACSWALLVAVAIGGAARLRAADDRADGGRLPRRPTSTASGALFARPADE